MEYLKMELRYIILRLTDMIRATTVSALAVSIQS